VEPLVELDGYPFVVDAGFTPGRGAGEEEDRD
jgi:hypothetical protein